MTRFVYVLPAGRFRWEVRVDLGDLDLSHLSAVARAATPGPWRLSENAAWRIWANRDPAGWDAFHIADCTDAGGNVVQSSLENAGFITTFDPPTVLELVNLIDTEPLFYRRKAHALIAARAIAILVGGEVQPHDRRGRIQDPDSYGPDPRETKG